MSVLESFVILFESDAKDVRTGAEQAEGASSKLENKLRDVDKQAGKAGESFSSLAGRAVNMLLPFVGLAALKGAALNFADSAYEAGQLGDSLRMDMELAQAWQGAAKRAGGTADGMAASIKNLNNNLEQIRKGGGGDAANALRELGVRARDSNGQLKSTDTVMRELAGKFDGLSQQSAARLGEKLGLDEGTILLLQKGSKGVEELLARQKELGVYNKKDAEEAKKFKNSWEDLKQAFVSVTAVIGRVLLPVFTAISGGMTTVAVNIKKHKELVKGFFIALSVIMGILAIKTGLACAPFLLVAAAILFVAACFAIVYDDVMAFLQGHDSVIGRLSKDYPWIGELVRDIVDVLALLWEVAKAVGTMLVECISDPARAFENFQAKIGPLIDAFAEKFPALGQAIKDVGTVVKWLWDMAQPLLKGLLALVKDVLGFIVDSITKIGGIIGKALSWAAKKIRGQDDDGKDDMDPLLDDKPKSKPKPEPQADDEDRELDAYMAEKSTPQPRKPGQPARKEPAPEQLTSAPAVVSEAPAPAENIPPAPALPMRMERQPVQLPPLPARPSGAAPVPSALPPMPSPHKMPPELALNINRGQQALKQTNVPLSSMPKGMQAKTENVSKTYNVTISKVDVVTQATDAEGISGGLGSALEAQLRSTMDNFDDGVRA